jgi:hypothetical protein
MVAQTSQRFISVALANAYGAVTSRTATLNVGSPVGTIFTNKVGKGKVGKGKLQ